MRLWPRRHGTSLDLLVVGLGNPGREYARNRHNVGWMVVDDLARRHDGSWRAAFNGRPVQAARKFFKLEPDAVLVVHDEGDLDLGRLQARLGGGLAGHNGLRSIAQHLKTPEFMRLRIGVGRPGRGDPRPLADYVLSDFTPEDDADALIARAADAIETLDAEGLDRTQARFN